MSLDHWWAGWRHEYINDAIVAGPDGLDASIFEMLLGADVSDEEARIVHRGERVSALLNAYPYNSGHVLVMPNRAVPRLDDLTDEEEIELWRTVRSAVDAIETAYEPEGVNVGLNLGRAAGAGVPGHLHVHCLPRWSGDTNFMTTIAETRVLPEPLDVTWHRLKDAWPN